MAQLTLYIPDAVADDLRRAAKRANKSLSSYVVQLVQGDKKAKKPSKAFLSTFGSWEGEFPKVPALPYERREKF